VLLLASRAFGFLLRLSLQLNFQASAFLCFCIAQGRRAGLLMLCKIEPGDAFVDRLKQ
jgi:hypothetical protein